MAFTIAVSPAVGSNGRRDHSRGTIRGSIAWAGLFGPANLPKEVVDRVAEAMKVISSRQDVRGSLDKIAFELQSSSPEEMATLLKDQLEVWRRTVQEVGIERN